MADVQLHAWLVLPAVADTLQKIVEEALLERDAIAAGEERPVRVAVRLEPLRRVLGRLGVAVEVTARMDALAAPVGAREQRRLDEREIRRARFVPLVVERMLLEVLERINAVLRHLFLGERHRTRDGFAGVRVLARVRAAA